MKALVQEKEKAINLRKKGSSYNEILKIVPVAKSSLSLWLKDLPLTNDEKRYLKTRTDANISRGRIKAASENRKNRLVKEKLQIAKARLLFAKYCHDNLFHTGVALYWAEGAKRNSAFQFTNSDVDMVVTMLCWLERFTDYHRNDLGYRLYIHKPYAHENCEKWWSQKMNVAITNFKNTTYKPTNLGIKKRPNYKGCLRVEVPRSTELLRYMKCWIEMSVEYYGKQ